MVTQNLQQAQAELYRRRDGLNGHARHIEDISPLVKDPRHFEPIEEPEKLKGLLANGRVTLNSLQVNHPKMRQAIKMARAWADRKRGGCNDASIILCGDNGVGKTHIALAIWWSISIRPLDGDGCPIPELPEQPISPFFLSNDLLAKLGNVRDADTGITVPARAVDAIGYPPMIIIDDVGAEQKIPFVAADDQEEERHARFFKIINHCYGNVSIVITTNLTGEQLAAHIGRRAADRLWQMAPRMAGGDSFIVDMFGVPSYRAKAGGR